MTFSRNIEFRERRESPDISIEECELDAGWTTLRRMFARPKHFQASVDNNDFVIHLERIRTRFTKSSQYYKHRIYEGRHSGKYRKENDQEAAR